MSKGIDLPRAGEVQECQQDRPTVGGRDTPSDSFAPDCSNSGLRQGQTTPEDNEDPGTVIEFTYHSNSPWELDGEQ